MALFSTSPLNGKVGMVRTKFDPAVVKTDADYI
jgi:hypothetical protein